MSDTRRTALVTGTSSGMGLHTAVGLASAGLRVLATMRDLDRAGALRKAAEVAGVVLDVQPLDVTDEDQAAALIDRLGPVDLLVNIAGRGSVASLEQLSNDDLRAQLEVNYISVASLTRLVLPGMRAVGAGRVVTVTSVGGVVGQPFADAYCGAKFAVEGLMQSLAPVASRMGIEVSIVEPAAVASSFVDNVGGLSGGVRDPEDPYATLLRAYLDRSAATFERAQSVESAAQVIVEAATTKSPRFRWQTSASAAAFAGLSLADLDGSAVLDTTATWLG